MKEIILNSVKLCIITLIAGVLLGTVYEITKEPRKKQEEKSKNEAYAKVFKDASKFEEMQYDEDELSNFLEENGYKKTVAYINEIVSANSESGVILGYVITVTDKEGYGGEIKFTLGIQNDGTINGISFLTLAETAGVGMKADESKFKNQFAGMKAETIEYVKSGKNADNQIDAISGATVTTNAVTNGVNVGVLAFQYISADDANTKNSDTDINAKQSDDKASNDEKESLGNSSDNDSEKQDEASNNDEEKQENSSNNDKEKQENSFDNDEEKQKNSSDNDEEKQKNSSDNDEEKQKNSSDNDEGTEKNNTNDSVTEENSKNDDEKGEESDE